MEQSTPLAEQLLADQTAFRQRAAPERVAMMEAATERLRAEPAEVLNAVAHARDAWLI